MRATLYLLERANIGIRAKVVHLFRVIKRQSGHVTVRYRGLSKNPWRLHTVVVLTARRWA